MKVKYYDYGLISYIMRPDASYTKFLYWNKSNKILYIDHMDSDNRKHNDNGPSYIEYHENGNVCFIYYYQHGLIHREDGPAIIRYHDNGDLADERYYLDNNLISKEEFVVFQLNKFLIKDDYIIKKTDFYEISNTITNKIIASCSFDSLEKILVELYDNRI